MGTILLLVLNTLHSINHFAQYLRVDPHYVRVGSATENYGGVVIPIKEIFRHQGEDFYKTDLALLQLTFPIRYTNKIRAINLPPKHATLKVGTMVTVGGFGFVEQYVNRHLRTVDLPVIDHEECTNIYGTNGWWTATVNMICAGEESCPGDRGSPLYKDNVLYGVVSWKLGRNQTSLPGLYAEVSAALDWIDSTVHQGVGKSSMN